MVVRASVAAMVIAMLLVILCVSCVFLCGVQLLHLGDSPFELVCLSVCLPPPLPCLRLPMNRQVVNCFYNYSVCH